MFFHRQGDWTRRCGGIVERSQRSSMGKQASYLAKCQWYSTLGFIGNQVCFIRFPEDLPRGTRNKTCDRIILNFALVPLSTKESVRSLCLASASASSELQKTEISYKLFRPYFLISSNNNDVGVKRYFAPNWCLRIAPLRSSSHNSASSLQL